MVARRSMGKQQQRRIWGTFNFTMLCGLGVLMALPFFWMLSTSLKVEQQVYLFPPIWIPNPWAWENYRISLFDILPFTRFFLNTIYITVTATVGAVLSSSMVAFAFARLRWPGRDKVFLLVLATMMVPTYSTIVPRFILFRHLDWVDTFWPLIVPLWFGGSAFFIFLMRQFYMTIPIDLDEAAGIDGCSEFRIWWSIILPLSRPALATITILSFMARWNDFFDPLIFLNTMENFTVALGLNMFRAAIEIYGVRYHWLMAASVTVLLPGLIIFFFFQKTFVQGVVMSGIKG
ncbi:MAG: carbohydrate ABC transporter permease [Caldilineaceae bacterium]|nr:carbohydrate ABC transporter permease [Caldilineaceae bacterium]MDE0078298.1 carbohydrate ABC transporter permease [Caldilineaceae bacterium]